MTVRDDATREALRECTLTMIQLERLRSGAITVSGLTTYEIESVLSELGLVTSVLDQELSERYGFPTDIAEEAR